MIQVDDTTALAQEAFDLIG